MNCDLIYVTKGALEVSFEDCTIDAKGSQVGQKKIFSEIFLQGDYIDFINKKNSKYKDYVIKSIKAY